jgi:mannitol-specific phosphotransferase system IIBC component
LSRTPDPNKASDAAMIVAIGKLEVFQQVWKQIAAIAEKKGMGAMRKNELRKHVKMAVDELDDAIFFIKPGPGKTQAMVEKELRTKLERANIQELIMKNLTKRLSTQQDLRAFLQEVSSE